MWSSSDSTYFIILVVLIINDLMKPIKSSLSFDSWAMCYKLARLIKVKSNFIVSGQIEAECATEKQMSIVIDTFRYVLIAATIDSRRINVNIMSFRMPSFAVLKSTVSKRQILYNFQIWLFQLCVVYLGDQTKSMRQFWIFCLLGRASSSLSLEQYSMMYVIVDICCWYWDPFLFLTLKNIFTSNSTKSISCARRSLVVDESDLIYFCILFSSSSPMLFSYILLSFSCLMIEWLCTYKYAMFQYLMLAIINS